MSWESGFTSFPGCFSFKGFTYRGQTLSGQIYLHLAEFKARISLPGLVSKKVHIRGVRGRDLDYRYRDRIDYPCWSADSGAAFPGVPEHFDDYPEIPGLDNPPDPKPEELYPRDPEVRPWTIRISGARIRGATRAAYNEIRLEGEGSIRGGLTAVYERSSAIDWARVRLVPATLRSGQKVLTEDLDLDVDIRVEPFPAVCPEVSEILEGTTGTLVVAGENAAGFAIGVDAFNPLLPGQGVLFLESGLGELGGRLEVSKGRISSGQLDFVADDVVLDHQGESLYGDLEVHLTLGRAELPSGSYDISGTTFRLDDIAAIARSEKQRQKLEPWYGHLEFEEGIVRWGEPVTLESRVRLKVEDTRPVLILLRKFTNKMKWLNLTRNVKGLDGRMDLGFGKGYLFIDDLSLTGEDVEILGWVHIRNQMKTGRIFTRHGSRAAGFAFDDGAGRVITIRPRRWFENQNQPPANDIRPIEEEVR